MLMWNPVKTARVDSSLKVTFSAVPSGRLELNDNHNFRLCLFAMCPVGILQRPNSCTCCGHCARVMYRGSGVPRSLVSFAKASALHGRCFYMFLLSLGKCHTYHEWA